MASKTRAILLAVVLLGAGLAGCADTGDQNQTDTGEPDTGEPDTGERDTGERDTGEQNQTEDMMFNQSFNDTIDEQNYQRNWTFPVNETGANISIEASLDGDAVDDFEATLWAPNQTEMCTVSARGGNQTGGTLQADQSQCQRDANATGDYTLQVWGNATMGEANYTINVTVMPGDAQTTTGGNETGGQDGPRETGERQTDERNTRETSERDTQEDGGIYN